MKTKTIIAITTTIIVAATDIQALVKSEIGVDRMRKLDSKIGLKH